ncbi:MAG: hypothetical protein JNJ54_14380 [Myxococcaceae bacterium]|nr:hypothetical protein [Myxococcaceae bacterium]
MMERLQHLLDEGIIDEVFQQLKTGKEAEVWLVSHRGEPVAAKLYKEREFRSFKNDAGYLEGRQVRNTRTQRAMDKGTAFGRRASEEAWKASEANALYALHAAGVRVPRPVLFYEGVLLMEVIGDAEGRVAPRLVEAGITREQAPGLYSRLRGEVVKMLAADLIHGDLSEFNILLGADGPVIIDFPQTVEAARNSRSEHFFRRDLGNLVRFFSGIDPDLARHQGDADEIWRAYTRRELSADFVPTGRSASRPPHPPRPGGPFHAGRADSPPGRRDERRGPPPWKQGRDGGKPRGPGEQRGPRGPEVSFKGQGQTPTGGASGVTTAAPRDANGPGARGSGGHAEHRGPPWKQGRDGGAPGSSEPRAARGPERSFNGQQSASGQAEHRGPPWKQGRDGEGRGTRGPERSFNGQPQGPSGRGEQRGSSEPRGTRGPERSFNGQPRGASGHAEQRGPSEPRETRGPERSFNGPPQGASGHAEHRGPPWKQSRDGGKPRGANERGPGASFNRQPTGEGGSDRRPAGGRDSRRRRPRRW